MSQCSVEVLSECFAAFGVGRYLIEEVFKLVWGGAGFRDVAEGGEEEHLCREQNIFGAGRL